MLNFLLMQSIDIPLGNKTLLCWLVSICVRERSSGWTLCWCKRGSVLWRIVWLCFQDGRVIGLYANRVEITEVWSVEVAKSLFACWCGGVQWDTANRQVWKASTCLNMFCVWWAEAFREFSKLVNFIQLLVNLTFHSSIRFYSLCDLVLIAVGAW